MKKWKYFILGITLIVLGIITFPTEKIEKNGYYYRQLDATERMAYVAISTGLFSHSNEIVLPTFNKKKTQKVFSSVLRDYPEIFWCNGGTIKFRLVCTVFAPEYDCTLEERKEKQKEIDQEVDKVISSVNPEASDYEKILTVYEYVVRETEYEKDSPDSWNMYSVFVNKKSVCAGYSKATQYLLKKLGVFCTYIPGSIIGEGPHAWNLVKCSGDYCYVDTTWGESQSQECTYDYMCCDDTELFKTHVIKDGVQVPACSTMAHNYYVVNGMYYESYEESRIIKQMRQDIEERKNTVLMFANEEVYQESRDKVLGDLIYYVTPKLESMRGSQETLCSYLDEPCKITIIWNYG